MSLSVQCEPYDIPINICIKIHFIQTIVIIFYKNTKYVIFTFYIIYFTNPPKVARLKFIGYFKSKFKLFLYKFIIPLSLYLHIIYSEAHKKQLAYSVFHCSYNCFRVGQMHEVDRSCLCCCCACPG